MDQDDYREGHRSQLYQVEPISRPICVLELSFTEFTQVSMTGLLEKYYGLVMVSNTLRLYFIVTRYGHSSI